MRLRINCLEDLDDFDAIFELTYEKSRALQKLLDGHRREERASQRDRRGRRFRGRRDHVDWDWSADDDWNSYDLDDYDDLERR